MRQSIMFCLHSSTMHLAVAGIGMMAIACTGEGVPSTASPNGSTISVVTTLYSLEYFARRIGGERVTVVNLVEPGVEAHSFAPTPADIRKLDGADVILYNGPAFEPWIPRAIAAISSRDRAVTQTGQEGEVKDDGLDPHVWLDPKLAVNQVRLIHSDLVKADREGAAVYATNATMLVAELEALHSRFSSNLDSCNRDHFVTSHAAFGHMANRYGLEQVSISGLSPEAVPGAGHMAEIADTIRELGVEYVMVEPVNSTGFAETLAREVGVELLPLHPLESLTPEQSKAGENFISLMEANLESLSLALGCNT